MDFEISAHFENSSWAMLSLIPATFLSKSIKFPPFLTILFLYNIHVYIKMFYNREFDKGFKSGKLMYNNLEGGRPMKNSIRFITRTALLLAVAVAFQIFGKFIPYNNFVVGPVVNAVLIVATAISGIWSGTAISVIAPLVSAFTNKAPIAPFIIAFSPFIALGNFVIVLAYHLLKKKSRILAVVAGAAVKFVVLYASVTLFTSLVQMPPQMAATLTNLFSWPQLVTALTGGAVALAVLAAIEKRIELV